MKACGWCNGTGLAFGIEFSDTGWVWAYQADIYDEAIVRRCELTKRNPDGVKVRTAAGQCICAAGDRMALRERAKMNKEEAKL